MSIILDDVKHMLGLLPNETAFDSDNVIGVNYVFGVSHQIGVGPPVGFAIDDASLNWADKE